tara:strand:- start:377 stop:559 length:183 start_codon:yes stop_codon:yes gene_type:complete
VVKEVLLKKHIQTPLNTDFIKIQKLFWGQNWGQKKLFFLLIISLISVFLPELNEEDMFMF